MKNNTTLINSLLSIYNVNTYVKNISLVLFGTLLLALSSKVQVPFWPVPMTMQTFIVFIIGMAYGWRLAFFTLVAYLFEGALGLPVFAKGGGLLYSNRTHSRLSLWHGNSSWCYRCFCGTWLQQFLF